MGKIIAGIPSNRLRGVMSKSFGNERDVEIPLLKETLRDRYFPRALDIGCEGSFYLEWLRPQVGYLVGCDLRWHPDFQERTYKHLDGFYIGDFERSLFQEKVFNLVVCISTIEHHRISQNFVNEIYAEVRRGTFVRKLKEVCRNELFLSFPFGQYVLHKNHQVIIPDEELSIYQVILGGKQSLSFFTCDDSPQIGGKWHKVNREEAAEFPYKESEGVRSICVMDVRY